MSLDQLKLSVSLFILLLTLAAGIYPFIRRIILQHAFNFSAAEALAGGVFFGAGLLHMLGDATNHFITLGFVYPWPLLIAGGMFLCLFSLEQMSQHSLNVKPNSQWFILIVIGMISLHSLFEGTALGLTNHIRFTIVLACAIMAHKWAASFALAVRINKTQLSLTKGLIYFLIFACMTPIGILLGNWISHQLQHHKLIEPICEALAAGTFLYLGSIHVLDRTVMIDKNNQRNHLKYVFLGFSVMAIVAVWV